VESTTFEDDEVLHLDQTLLVGLLDRVKSVDSMQAMRRATVDLKQRLLAGEGVPSGPASDNMVVFGTDYLRGQLDQIAASRTLERARYYLERLEKSITQVRTNGVNDINLNPPTACGSWIAATTQGSTRPATGVTSFPRYPTR
jgi:hypothetical protein